MSGHREFSEVALTDRMASLRRAAAPGPPGSPCAEPEREAPQHRLKLGGQRRTRGTGVPSLMIVAESETDVPTALGRDRRAFQLKERVMSSDVSDPRVAAQLIELIGWALVDAEHAESEGTRRASCP